MRSGVLVEQKVKHIEDCGILEINLIGPVGVHERGYKPASYATACMAIEFPVMALRRCWWGCGPPGIYSDRVQEICNRCKINGRKQQKKGGLRKG